MASTDPEPEPEDAITKDEIAAAAPAPPAAPDVGASQGTKRNACELPLFFFFSSYCFCLALILGKL